MNNHFAFSSYQFQFKFSYLLMTDFLNLSATRSQRGPRSGQGQVLHERGISGFKMFTSFFLLLGLMMKLLEACFCLTEMVRTRTRILVILPHEYCLFNPSPAWMVSLD